MFGYLQKKPTQGKGEIIFSSRKVESSLFFFFMKGHLLHNIDNENVQNLRLKLILPPNEQGNRVLGLTY